MNVQLDRDVVGILDHLAGHRDPGDVEHLRLRPVLERTLAKDAEARPPMRLVPADDQNGLGGDLVEGVGVAVVGQWLRVVGLTALEPEVMIFFCLI